MARSKQVEFRWVRRTLTFDKPFSSGLYEHSAVRLGDKIVVFGGNSSAFATHCSNELLALDVKKEVWTVINVNPPKRKPNPRQGTGLALAEDKMFIFGGYNTAHKLGDLWEFDICTCHWSRVFPHREYLEDLSYVAANYVSKLKKIALFGGSLRRGKTSSVRMFDPETNELRTLETKGLSPTPRSSAGSYVEHDKLFIISGYSETGWACDVYVLNLASTTPIWSMLSTSQERLIESGPTVFRNELFENMFLIFDGTKLVMHNLITGSWSSLGQMCEGIELQNPLLSITGYSQPPKANFHAMLQVSHDTYALIGGRTNNAAKYPLNQYYLLKISQV